MNLSTVHDVPGCQRRKFRSCGAVALWLCVVEEVAMRVSISRLNIEHASVQLSSFRDMQSMTSSPLYLLCTRSLSFHMTSYRSDPFLLLVPFHTCSIVLAVKDSMNKH